MWRRDLRSHACYPVVMWSWPRPIRRLISVVVSNAARLRGALLVNWLQDLFPKWLPS